MIGPGFSQTKTRPRLGGARINTMSMALLLVLLVVVSSFGYSLMISGKPNATPTSTSASSTSNPPSPCTITETNLSRGCVGELERQRIAVVKSVFTSTPYAYNAESSFYAFYTWASKKVASCTNQNLQWLNTTVVDSWGAYGGGLERFMQSSTKAGYFNATSTHVLTDIQIGDGALFTASGHRKFDVVIMGFTEYATQAEYLQLKSFVSTGGKLIMLVSNSFIAEVAYSHKTNTERLVLGHGWSFDGKTACRGAYLRWREENANWVGSNYCCFHTAGYAIRGAMANTTDPLSAIMRKAFGEAILQSYQPHEESAIANLTNTRIVAYWEVAFKSGSLGLVAIYSHRYCEGLVINTGVFGTDLIESDRQLQFLVYASLLTGG